LQALPATGSLGIGMSLWVACDDADAFRDLIISRHGTVGSPVADGPFGRFFVAVDPDGYAITFHTPRS
jgi:predicted enzyme related to lactoylglutathione lyase